MGWKLNSTKAILSLVCLVLGGTEAVDNCPVIDGWIDLGDIGCYNFLPEQIGISWLAAKLACELEGGYLAELKTDRASDTIGSLTSLIPGVTKWFIGLTDLEQEGTWQWFLSHETVNTTKWGPGSPAESEENNRDCVLLSLDRNGKVVWTDVSCSGIVLDGAPICEFGEASLVTCPTDWVLYGGHCYGFFIQLMSWDDAETYCVGQGGHLVSLNDAAEEQAVQALVESVYGSSKIFWTGGKRTAPAPGGEDTVTWSDGSDGRSYSHWVDSTTGNYDDQCVYQTRDSAGWKSATCSAAASFVCQK